MKLRKLEGCVQIIDQGAIDSGIGKSVTIFWRGWKIAKRMNVSNDIKWLGNIRYSNTK